MRTRTRGFTLVELILAMSLFLVLGTALVALLARAMDFLDTGSQGTEVLDKSMDFLRPLKADLQNVLVERRGDPGVPEIRFYSDYVPLDPGGKGRTTMWAQRLAFVRSTEEEAADRVTRAAGTKAGAQAFLDGRNDGPEAAAGRLRAPGGMQEVLYMAVPEDPRDPGLLTLYRGIRSPVGGPGSLLDPKTVRSAADLKKVAQPLLAGVLHFEVRFWTSRTKSWQPDSVVPSEDGPALSWDSTRGILPPGLRPNRFPFARGPASLADPRDDISPRAVRVQVVFEPTGTDVRIARLLEPVDERQTRVEVDTPEIASLTDDRAIKVGAEWMSYSSILGTTFSIVNRGFRGTEATRHAAGERVRVGTRVEREIRIPAFREDRSFR